MVEALVDRWDEVDRKPKRLAVRFTVRINLPTAIPVVE
jgi:hypothetical protein